MIKNRLIFEKLLRERDKKRVSIILGPRQVGKTTALQYIYENICMTEDTKGIYLDLDVYSNFEKVSTYENAINTFILNGYKSESDKKFYVFLDEFQRYQDLTLIIKNIYDHNKNIKIYASGSSSLAIKYSIQETLAGRKNILYCLPLTFEEFLQFKGEKQLEEKFHNVPMLKGDSLDATIKELFILLEEFIIFGGYPEVVLAERKEDKIEILKSIFDLYAKKELMEYLKIDKIYETKKLIQFLAVNNAQKIKYQDLAQTTGFTQKTVKNYIQLLQETFLIQEVRPFFTNKNRELVKIPKIYFLDPGVANFFINNFNPLDLRKDSPYLFETYVLGELIKSGIEKETINFWQDKNQNEVDFVIQNGDLLGIEVKFKKSLKKDDFSSCNTFSKEYPNAKCFLINLNSQEEHNSIQTLLPYNINKGIIPQINHSNGSGENLTRFSVGEIERITI